MSTHLKILVLGGTGFVGQYVVRELASAGHTVIVGCRKKRSDLFINIWKLPNITVVEGIDIADYDSFHTLCAGVDAVCNVAGFVSFKQADRERLMCTNHTGALNVLRAAKEHGVKKLVHLSSTAALGFSQNELHEHSPDFDWSKYQNCCYSLSKYLSNKEITDSSVHTVLVYAPLILGPGDKTNTVKLLKAIKQRQIPFNSPGKNSVVDVRDLARALVFFLVHPFSKPHERFIVAGGNYSFKQLHETIARVVGSKAPIITIPKFFRIPILMLAYLIERIHPDPPVTYETVFWSFTDRVHTTKKLSSMGFKPHYTLSQTTENAWNWIVKNNL